MTNKTPLLRYNIDHISPSFINQFMLDPVKATKQKFEKIQDEPNMNMFRGTCMEKFVQGVLQKQIDPARAESWVKEYLSNKTAFTNISDDDKEKELDNLLGNKKSKGMIKNCLETLEDLEISDLRFQQKYSALLNKTKTKIVGITDMECYSKKLMSQVCIDFKASMQIRELSLDNKVQGAVYHRFTNKNIYFLKCSRARAELQPMTSEDIYEGLETAVHIINIIENICERFDTIDEYYKCIYPFKKYDRSEIMNKEIKKTYRRLFNTQENYERSKK